MKKTLAMLFAITLTASISLQAMEFSSYSLTGFINWLQSFEPAESSANNTSNEDDEADNLALMLLLSTFIMAEL